MSRRPAGALAGIAMILLLASPASAAGPPHGPGEPPQRPGGALDVPRPALPLRDIVLSGPPDTGSAGISATAPTRRYPIGDGSGATIAVGVTAACLATCDAADPRAIANFIGTLPHGREVRRLTVQLDTRWQIAYDCGYGAQACYDGWRSKIIISGDDEVQHDGATREFVLAHEYGHHLAGHRPAPAPFSPAIDWGTPRWASYMNVCRGERQGRFFPGNQGWRYHRNPGEAFAEAFAFSHFPDAQTGWAWNAALKPDARAFAAIRRDVYRPWSQRSFTIRGRLPGTRGRAVARTFPTPLDGRASVRLRGPGARSARLLVRGAGKPRTIPGGEALKLTVCDQGNLRAVVKPGHGRAHRFTLAVKRP